MIVLSKNDFLEVKLMSLFADYDVETLTNLYQPIIGYQAFSLYFSLLIEANNQKISSMISHEYLFNRMQIQPGDFVEARKTLEAIGLVRTYVQKIQGSNIYTYNIYAPKTPKSFFDNALLFGLLVKYIGEKESSLLKSIYSYEFSNEKGEEITSSFQSVFHPDFDNPIFASVLANKANIVDRVNGKIALGFSYEAFFEALSSISQISSSAFTKKEMKEIERLSSLFGISEESAANYVSDLYNPHEEKGERIDFESLTKAFANDNNYHFLKMKRNENRPNLVSGNTDLANKINGMETISPKDYLSILQNGTKVASADLNLINDLSYSFHLTNGVINAIVDFVLTVNHNVLSRAYCEKVAASIARENITTTIDAMNYLNRTNRNKKSKKKIEEVVEDKTDKEDENSEINLSWDETLKEIEGDANGKN